MRRHNPSTIARLACCAGIAAAGAISQASAAPPQYNVLYQFPGGVHGIQPEAGVILGPAGSLFGTTDTDGVNGGGGGVVFQLTAPAAGESGPWAQTILKRFPHSAGAQGAYPLGLLLAPSGTLYGVTLDGGGNSNASGTVFSLAPAPDSSTWTFATLYRFRGGNDGDLASGSLIMDASGTLSGTTILGGSGLGQDGYGVAFSLTPPPSGESGWTETVLHRFKSSPDGATPAGTLLALGGHLYGVSTTGGTGVCSDTGCGTVFRLTQTENGWSETIIWQFQGGADGSGPTDRLIADAKGSLYGATTEGGLPGSNGVYETGTVFRLDPPATGKSQWTKTVLYEFQGDTDGQLPDGGLTFDTNGALYGTTQFGGPNFHGIVYKLTPNAPGQPWTKTTLHSFPSRSDDGSYPTGPLTLDNSGNIYGTTWQGGRSNDGTVYRITQQP